MKSYLIFKDGHVEEREDAVVSVDTDAQTVCFIDMEGGIVSDDVPMDLLKRWETLL